VKIETRKVEVITITYNEGEEETEAFNYCKNHGFAISERFSVKQSPMKYTGEGVIIASRPLGEDSMEGEKVGV
jgi:hypothetical protein